MNTVLSTFFKLAAASIISLTDGNTRMLIGAVFVAMTPPSVYLFNTQIKRFFRVVNKYTSCAWGSISERNTSISIRCDQPSPKHQKAPSIRRSNTRLNMLTALTIWTMRSSNRLVCYLLPSASASKGRKVSRWSSVTIWNWQTGPGGQFVPTNVGAPAKKLRRFWSVLALNSASGCG
jgi:hypothetical protein